MEKGFDLFNKGYYRGSLDELFPKKSILEEYFYQIKQSFFDEKSRESTWQYNSAILETQRFPNIIPVSQVPYRREFIKKNKFNVFQQLYIAPVPDNIRKVFHKQIIEYITPLYPIDHRHYYSNNDSLSCMLDGDYIKNHKDGNNEGRLCGIIIHLSELDDYEKSQGGGELVLNNAISIPPVKGTFTILDYVHNNLEHEVKPVKNNFVRFAYVNFVSKIPIDK